MHHQLRNIGRPKGYTKKDSAFGPDWGEVVARYETGFVFDPNDLELGDDEYGTPTLLWIDGDGTTPRLTPNPLLSLAASGTVNSGGATPYTYPGAIDATSEGYGVTSYRTDATHTVDPGVNDDIVVVMKHMIHTTPLMVGPYTAVTTRRSAGGTGDGWGLVYGGGGGSSMIGAVWTAGGDAVSIVGAIPMAYGSWGVSVFLVNRDGNIVMLHNGVVGAPAACPVGAMTGNGFAINAEVSGATPPPAGRRVEYVAVWYGAGLWETWSADSYALAKKITFESLGLRETVNRSLWAYTRAAGDSCALDHNGRWWVYNAGAPPAGNSTGMRVTPTLENLAARYNGVVYASNFSPSAPTGMTVTGGTIAMAADGAALAAASAAAWAPSGSVFEFSNGTGVTQYLYTGFAGADATPHSLTVLGRYFAGAGAELGLYDTAAASFTKAADILDNYTLTLGQDITTTSATQKWAIKAPAGARVRFVAQTLAAISRLDAPIPTATGNTKDGDTGTTIYTPGDTVGSLAVEITPRGWSAGEIGQDSLMITRETACELLRTDTASGTWAARPDGASEVVGGGFTPPADGVTQTVWVGWQGGTQALAEDTGDLPATASYGGALAGSGAVVAAADYGTYSLHSVEFREAT